MPEEITKYVVKSVSKDYNLEDSEIIEIFEDEAGKIREFSNLINRENLRHFEKNKFFRLALKTTKKKCYLMLRQHDRSTVAEKEKLLDELIENCKKNSNLCIESHKKILFTHVSTQKRLNIYEEFYEKIFELTGRPESILDIGAGINAFSIPFMNLNNLEYLGIEKKEKDIRLVNRYIKSQKLNAKMLKFDFNEIEKKNPFDKKYDLCLILKTIPLLERYNRGISIKLLKAIPSNKFAISGSRVSMVKGKNIEARERKQISQIIRKSGLEIKEILKFPDEIVFIAVK